jgi:hypothetical protein
MDPGSMTTHASLAAFLLLVSASPSAMASTATPDEALRLTGIFESYLGQTPGVVTVVPGGDSYDVKIDFAPLFAKAPGKDFTASVTPLTMKLASQGGGKWLVTQDQAFSVVVQVPDALDLSAKVGSLRGSGVFDESLAAFASSTTDIFDFSLDETITTPGAGPTHVAYAVKTVHYETTMEAAAGGGIDGTVKAEMAGLIETFAIPMSPDAATPPMDVTVTIAKGTQDATMKGLRSKPVFDLLAWFIAHWSDEAITANQSELKALLRASLPLFKNMAGTGTLETLSAMTPFGPVGIDRLEFGASFNGIVADGMLHEKFSASGLKLPTGLVPPWAAGLVPNAINFDFSVADFNAAAPAALIVDSLDLTANPPFKPELEQHFLAALLPKGTVTISLGPSGIAGKLVELAIEGSMTAGPIAMPVGQATVKAKGIEQVMEALKAAPAEMGLQRAIGGLIAAKGLSKQEADGSLSWKIESTPAGSVLINGIDPSKM